MCSPISSVEQIGYDRGVEAEAKRSRELILEAQRSIERSLKRERSLILRLLIRKVGPINDRSLMEINTLSIEQLESLGEELLDFGSLYDLTNWLETR